MCRKTSRTTTFRSKSWGIDKLRSPNVPFPTNRSRFASTPVPTREARPMRVRLNPCESLKRHDTFAL